MCWVVSNETANNFSAEWNLKPVQIHVKPSFHNKFCFVEDCVSSSIKEMKHCSIYEKFILQQSNCVGIKANFILYIL